MGGTGSPCHCDGIEERLTRLLQSWHPFADLQIWRRPDVNYGEAVGITPIYETSRDALASLAPQHREIRLVCSPVSLTLLPESWHRQIAISRFGL